MRALVIFVVLAIAAPAFADEVPVEPAPPAAKLEIKPGHAEIMPTPIIDDNPVVGHPKPSGYWTGYRPARGGAYRWRMMAIALVVLGITIFFVARMLRRASRRPV